MTHKSNDHISSLHFLCNSSNYEIHRKGNGFSGFFCLQTSLCWSEIIYVTPAIFPLLSEYMYAWRVPWYKWLVLSVYVELRHSLGLFYHRNVIYRREYKRNLILECQNSLVGYVAEIMENPLSTLIFHFFTSFVVVGGQIIFAKN